VTTVTATSRLRTAADIAADLGCAAALLTDSASVRWAGLDGDRALVVDGEALPVGAEAESLRRALAEADVRPGDAVAIEPASLTVAAAAGLGNRRCPSIAGRLAVARMRKDPDEIALIEAAAELVAVGQAAAREAAGSGRTELDLWAAARTAMEKVARQPVEAVVDLMAGERTELVGVPPSSHEATGPVLFDLAPCRDGYWADSCATFATTEPSAALRRRHDAVRRALDRGIAAARPGVTAHQLDATLRETLDLPHHGGHGVGAAAQEPPWIVPGDETVLDEGMVVALEPGHYGDGFGIRLEHLIAIEAGGARVLTTHDIDL
jgi:Xaa-Pro aminopeptidase